MKNSHKSWNNDFWKSLKQQQVHPTVIESFESDTEEDQDYSEQEDSTNYYSSGEYTNEIGVKVKDAAVNPTTNVEIEQAGMDFALSLPKETQDWMLSEELAFLDKLVRETYPERIKALQFLKNILKSNNVSAYFDEEDFKWVDEDLTKQTEELKNLHQIWKETTSVYQNTLLKLANTIQVRQKVLSYVDEKTNIFSERPKLVEMFAKKQADLTALMDVCKDNIRLEQQEVRERIAKENADQISILQELRGLDEAVSSTVYQTPSNENNQNPSGNITTTVADVKKLVDERSKGRTLKKRSKSKNSTHKHAKNLTSLK